MTLEEAKEILKDYNLINGNIVWGGKPFGMNPEYVNYRHIELNNSVTLDGEFSDTELEAIITIMRQPK